MLDYQYKLQKPLSIDYGRSFKQNEFDVDPRAFQQIEFYGMLKTKSQKTKYAQF